MDDEDGFQIIRGGRKQKTTNNADSSDEDNGFDVQKNLNQEEKLEYKLNDQGLYNIYIHQFCESKHLEFYRSSKFLPIDHHKLEKYGKERTYI